MRHTKSLYYEHLKHSGELPIIAVNTFLGSGGSKTVIPGEVIRATEEEKQYQIHMLEQLHTTWKEESTVALKLLQKKAINNQNVLEALMEATKTSSIGQITNALFSVGGQYRRNM